jgi:hypothetical protein
MQEMQKTQEAGMKTEDLRNPMAKLHWFYNKS